MDLGTCLAVVRVAGLNLIQFGGTCLEVLVKGFECLVKANIARSRHGYKLNSNSLKHCTFLFLIEFSLCA